MTEPNNDWLLKTIVAKSDQLNAVDLVGGPITVTVHSVTQGEADQPVIIGIGPERQPYKPCKSMRRVLIACWGSNPATWIGRKMTLYCEASVKWGGESVGGVRISHLSHLPNAIQEVQLNESKHKKITYKVFALVIDNTERAASAIAAINKAANKQELEKTWSMSAKLYDECGEELKNNLDVAYTLRKEAL